MTSLPGFRRPKVLAAERPTELLLKAKGFEYAMLGGNAVTVVVVERTPE
jgi:hypothetical protein